MEKSNEIDKLAKALSDFQHELTPAPLTDTVKVATKSGSSYNFKYAPLPVIKEHVKELLHKNELSVSQSIGKDGLTTILMHSSGQWISDITPCSDNGKSTQEYGSVITYIRRYAYSSILGIVSDEDDDGNKADGNSYEKTSSGTNSQPKGDRPKYVFGYYKNEALEELTREKVDGFLKWISENKTKPKAIEKFVAGLSQFRCEKDLQIEILNALEIKQ